MFYGDDKRNHRYHDNPKNKREGKTAIRTMNGVKRENNCVKIWEEKEKLHRPKLELTRLLVCLMEINAFQGMNDEEFIKLKTYLTYLGNVIAQTFIFSRKLWTFLQKICHIITVITISWSIIRDNRFSEKCKHKALSKVQKESENVKNALIIQTICDSVDHWNKAEIFNSMQGRYFYENR